MEIFVYANILKNGDIYTERQENSLEALCQPKNTDSLSVPDLDLVGRYELQHYYIIIL